MSARDFLCSATRTVAVALAPSHVQVIVASPAFSAVTSPESETVAMSASVVAQLIVRPNNVSPLARLGRAVSWTWPPTATVTVRGLSTSPVTLVVAAVPPAVRPRPTGVGLAGVLNFASSCELPPCAASVIILVRIGSSGGSGAAPNAATAASTFGQRFSGSFSSIRITAALSAGGQSGRAPSIGGGGSLKCAYMIAMTESALNGSRPASIAEAPTPSEYCSGAGFSSFGAAPSSGLMYDGVPTVAPSYMSPEQC